MNDQVEVDPDRLAASAKSFDAKADECDKLATRFDELLGPVASGVDPDLAILKNQVAGPAAQVGAALEGIAMYLRGTGEGLRVSAQLYSDTDAANVDRARQVAAAAAAIDDAAGSGGGSSSDGGAGSGDGRADSGGVDSGGADSGDGGSGGSSSAGGGSGGDTSGFDWISTGSGSAVGVTQGTVDGLGSDDTDGKSDGGGADKGGGLSASTHSSTGGEGSSGPDWTASGPGVLVGQGVGQVSDGKGSAGGDGGAGGQGLDDPDMRWTPSGDPVVVGQTADGEDIVEQAYIVSSQVKTYGAVYDPDHPDGDGPMPTFDADGNLRGADGSIIEPTEPTGVAGSTLPADWKAGDPLPGRS